MNNQLLESQAPVPGGNGVGDSRYPQLGNSGYDVQQYNLDLKVVDVATSNLNATANIEAKATQDLSSFNLDFAGFEIESITVNGQAAEFSRDGDELTVKPTESLHQGDNFVVDVKYNGSPKPTQSLSFTNPEAPKFPSGWVTYDGGSYVVGEPNGSETFYPVNNHPLDKASYNFRVTTPKPYEVAANGVLEETIDNGNTNTYVFEASDPMASYLSTVNIYKGFNTETQTSPNGVPIRNYFAEGIPEEKLEAFKRQPEMIDYFSEIFGPYPFEVYGSVVVNTPINVGAMETQTLSVFGQETLNSPIQEEIVAHELAHQWFGNSLSLSDWGDLWLNESFATYAQGLWVEKSQGGTEALNDWVKQQFLTAAIDFENFVKPGDPPADNLFNDTSVYTWGSVGLHALRQEVGDEAFFESLKTYNENFQGGNVKPEDFINIVESNSGQELDTFFDRWFYSDQLTSMPELGFFAGTAEGDTLTGTDQENFLSGLDGNDTLIGNGGVNVLIGNSGDDLLEGGDTKNSYVAGTGNDTIYAKGETNIIVSGDDGNDSDTIWLNGGNNQVHLLAGSGHDVINNFQLGSTTLYVENIDQLSFVGTAEGTQIKQGDDLLAVATSQSADVFSSNIDTIFQSGAVTA